MLCCMKGQICGKMTQDKVIMIRMFQHLQMIKVIRAQLVVKENLMLTSMLKSVTNQNGVVVNLVILKIMSQQMINVKMTIFLQQKLVIKGQMIMTQRVTSVEKTKIMVLKSKTILVLLQRVKIKLIKVQLRHHHKKLDIKKLVTKEEKILLEKEYS